MTIFQQQGVSHSQEQYFLDKEIVIVNITTAFCIHYTWPDNILKRYYVILGLKTIVFFTHGLTIF